MLLLALGFTAVSVFIDIFLEHILLEVGNNWENFLEDGTKLLGIACWCSYHVQTAYLFLAEKGQEPDLIEESGRSPSPCNLP